MRRVPRPLIAGLIVSAAALITVSLLLRRLIPSVGDEESDEIALAAAGNGIEIASRAAAFRGGSVRAIMGGLELDLTRARLDPGGARLDVRAFFGGVELIVPADWPLRVLAAKAIAGGFDHPEPDAADADAGPVLELDLKAILGGIDVRRRPRPDELPSTRVARGSADRR